MFVFIKVFDAIYENFGCTEFMKVFVMLLKLYPCIEFTLQKKAAFAIPISCLTHFVGFIASKAEPVHFYYRREPAFRVYRWRTLPLRIAIPLSLPAANSAAGVAVLLLPLVPFSLIRKVNK